MDHYSGAPLDHFSDMPYEGNGNPDHDYPQDGLDDVHLLAAPVTLNSNGDSSLAIYQDSVPSITDHHDKS